MRCQEFKDYLDDYCRGKLDQQLAKEFELHFAGCKTCAAEYQEHASLLSLMAREPELEIDPAELADFLPGVWEKIEATNKLSLTGWLKRLVPAAAAAALLIMAIFQPAINTVSLNIADLDNSDIGYSLLTSDYYYVDTDTIYTNDYYFDLLSSLFTDDDSETLDLAEEQLSSDVGLFSENTFDLSTLSDESLENLDRKLSELLNTAG